MLSENTLLSRMLRLLDKGGIQSTAALAQRLGVSEALVSAMVEDLARRGYLAAVDNGCGAACGGCAVARLCEVRAGSQTGHALLWLTARGRKAIGS